MGRAEAPFWPRPPDMGESPVRRTGPPRAVVKQGNLWCVMERE